MQASGSQRKRHRPYPERSDPRAVIDFTIADGKIVEIGLVAEPERLSELAWAVLKG